jgi:hypothetical protein
VTGGGPPDGTPEPPERPIESDGGALAEPLGAPLAGKGLDVSMELDGALNVAPGGPASDP